MLDSLPVEIIEQVFGNVAGRCDGSILDRVTSLLHLALTCKRLYIVGKPFVHDTVCLDGQLHSCNFTQPRIIDQMQSFAVRRLFVGRDTWKVSVSSTRVTLLGLFPNVEELAWIETLRETVTVGHHLTRRRTESMGGRQYFSNVSEYHLIVPGLYWMDLCSMEVPSGTPLEHLTITIWTGSQPMTIGGQTEDALTWLFDRHSHLKDLCIRIGHNATGFGSRIERMKRSFMISNAVRQFNDDRVRLEVAQYMFGTNNMTHSEDIFTCLKASWMESLDYAGASTGRSFARYNLINSPLQ